MPDRHDSPSARSAQSAGGMPTLRFRSGSPRQRRPQNRLRPSLLALSALFATATTAVALLTEPDAAALAADAARAVAGDRAVANLEDVVYGARDWLDRARHDGESPQAHWAAPRTAPAPAQPAWNPRDVGPMFDDFAAEGDGVWVPVRTEGDTTPIMTKTLLHPDRTRAFAELFVVAIDLSAVTLHYVAGAEEPESAARGAEHYVRESKVPARHRDVLLAAFNGGFKTRHGRHGVAIDGTTLVPFRAGLCTLVGQSDGSIQLAAFEKVAPRGESRPGSPPEGRRPQTSPVFVRQTARCLVEDGERHPALVRELTASWGAAVGGDTVIRRSAVGMSADRRTLFVGVSNRTTATALADGMRHAGASTAAQLDVNEAFPRFLTYHKGGEGDLVAESVAPGFVHRKGHYVSAPSSRDFFYVTRKIAPLAARENASLEAG